MNTYKRKNFLYPQTKDKPKYWVSILSDSGKKWCLADPKANRLALALMDMQAILGGAASHWGGPSAFVEIVSALYALVFAKANEKNCHWQDLFHLINDAGHCENGLYAIKANYGLGGLSFKDLKGFRSLNSVLTGHGEAHLFPEAVYLSNGPLASTLAQAQGLCMSDCLTKSNRHTIVLMSDGACMEGEAKEAFTSIPGFFNKKQMNPFTVIVSDNNTKLSGRIDKDSYSLDPFFKSLEALGWEFIEIPVANDLKNCLNTLEKLLFYSPSKPPARPTFIRAKTIKGYGVKATETSESGGHGFPLKDTTHLKELLEEISKDIPPEFMDWCNELEAQDKKKKKILKDKNINSSLKKIKVQAGIGKAMIHCREKNWPVVSISADLQGSTGVQPFRKAFPQFSFDVGVAEANMVSLATGFSKQGFIPVVDTFTQFGVTKGALPLFMANLSQAPVIAVFSHAGLQDAADGASHQSLTYIAKTCALPRTDVYCLSSSEEAFSLLIQAIESFKLDYEKGNIPRTKIFFLGREVFPASYLSKEYSYQLGRSQIIFSHLEQKQPAKKAVTILACGPLLEQALEAGQLLAQKSWQVIVLNASIINHPDMETLISCLNKTNCNLLTIEDHYLIGGMASLVSHQLALRGINVTLKSLAVRSDFGRSAYKSIELYEKEKLSASNIIACAEGLYP